MLLKRSSSERTALTAPFISLLRASIRSVAFARLVIGSTGWARRTSIGERKFIVASVSEMSSVEIALLFYLFHGTVEAQRHDVGKRAEIMV